VPPPSRGKWNAGASAPSTRRWCSTVADPARRGAVPAASGDLNRFDAALCDVAAAAVLDDFLDDLRAAAPGIFALFVFARAADFDLDFRLAVPPAFRAGEVLGDFLRDFLDIRLPFVAFGGSIMDILRILSGEPEFEPATVQVSRRFKSRLCKSDGAGVWLQGIDAPVRSLRRAVSAR
jgi:hypothetical protein